MSAACRSCCRDFTYSPGAAADPDIAGAVPRDILRIRSRLVARGRSKQAAYPSHS